MARAIALKSWATRVLAARGRYGGAASTAWPARRFETFLLPAILGDTFRSCRVFSGKVVSDRGDQRRKPVENRAAAVRGPQAGRYAVTVTIARPACTLSSTKA